MLSKYQHQVLEEIKKMSIEWRTARGYGVARNTLDALVAKGKLRKKCVNGYISFPGSCVFYKLKEENSNDKSG